MSSSCRQRAKDDVLQKEVKVKILKDSIHLLVSRSPPSAGGGSQQLTSELDGVLANYHKLCDRLKSKCHTLEVSGHVSPSAARFSRWSSRARGETSEPRV